MLNTMTGLTIIFGVIWLFFKVNGVTLSVKNILLAYLLRLPMIVLLLLLMVLSGTTIFNFLDDPLYGLFLAGYFLRPISRTLLIFYGLFVTILFDIFFRSTEYFIIPFFGDRDSLLSTPLPALLTYVFVICLVLVFLKWLNYDFRHLKTRLLEVDDRRVIIFANWVMAGYFVVIETLAFLDYAKGLPTLAGRQLILVLYLVFFMGLVKQLDSHLRQKLQAQLQFQQDMQLTNLEQYSQQIEGLYREVRGFRHDYANLMTTLRLGIEEENLDQIRMVYDSVMATANSRLKHQKYDVGRLINLNNSALKSLLAAKFLQASEEGVAVTLEVPEPIEPAGMALVDFITIVSILCDNAREAALEAAQPQLTIAYLTAKDKQVFIVENSTKAASVAIGDLYAFGVTSKGQGRGIGLYNAMSLIDRYPNVSLNTSSSNHTFCQVLEIGLD